MQRQALKTELDYLFSLSMNQRVLLGMSGGTDSSVAAILLLEQGYDVVGITFRFWEEGENVHLQDAIALAIQLGILTRRICIGIVYAA